MLSHLPGIVAVDDTRQQNCFHRLSNSSLEVRKREEETGGYVG
jgi:hypothetical protein